MKNLPGCLAGPAAGDRPGIWLGLCRWQSELDEQLTTAIAISNQASTGRRAASCEPSKTFRRDMSSSVACIQMQIRLQQQIQIHLQGQLQAAAAGAASAVTDTALSLFVVVSVAHCCMCICIYSSSCICICIKPS